MPRTDPEARATYDRDYYAARRDELAEAARTRRADFTPEQRAADNLTSAKRQRKPEYLARRTAEIAATRREVIIGYGGRCECCGNAFMPHLTLDHVNGDGAARRREERIGTTLRRLRKMLRETGQRDSRFQVLCWNCNLAKHLCGGRCPCMDHPILDPAAALANSIASS